MADPQIWLCVNCTRQAPSFYVAEEQGRCIGTTRLLPHHELPAVARWLGQMGGRHLLDAFEVCLINDGALQLWPIDADGASLYDKVVAQRIEWHDTGARIVWREERECPDCVDADPECLYCHGAGSTLGEEFATDMDGVMIGAEGCSA